MFYILVSKLHRFECNQVNYLSNLYMKRTPKIARPLKVRSLAEFIQIVDSIVDFWTKENGSFIYPWFRGHSNEGFSLLPSIYRNSNLFKNEDVYREDFIFKAYPFLDNSFYRPTTDLEWYFLMQHYGLPTRLLDWTEGSLIALHFAINYKKDDQNPCVWVLNPFGFNKVFTKKQQIYRDENILNRYLFKPWSKQKLARKPIAILPLINSKRLYSQKGCFMIFGSEQIDLAKEKEDDQYLLKIKIDFDALEKIRDSLVVAGVTESTIFPELSGLSKEIVHYYRGE